MDIAKNFFQVHAVDKNGKDVFNRKLHRSKVLEFFANLPICLIGLEACGGAHYWGRELAKLGHDVRLISPRLVKPFVINNKTDAADACAICEVVSRPSTKFVNIKTEEQQLLATLHRTRDRIIKARTMLVNQTRSTLLEFGIVIPKGIAHIQKAFPLLLDGSIPRCEGALRELIKDFYEEFLELNARIDNIDKEVTIFAKTNGLCKRLLKIPGVGPITATLVVAHVGDAKQYKNGRQFAAAIGLTPREHSSGGKQKMLGITKRGNRGIRSLLVQGALSIGRYWGKQDAGEDGRKQRYQGVPLRSNMFKAAVAQANKTARIIWAVLARGEEYKAQLA